MDPNTEIHRVAFLGDYSPRKCGIATFTTDLLEAVAGAFPDTQCFALPINDRLQGYDYPSAVRFEIAEKDLDAYRRAADYLNLNHTDVLCVQHEFGIYGGEAGAHVLTLLRGVRMPVVTTLHTVLEKPSDAQRRVMSRLTQLTDRFVVMTRKAETMLETVYHVPREKIDIIAHGIPDIPFVDPNFYKDKFGVAGKTVLLTFGLLSSGKGIENVIEAMPAILQKHPNVVYIVLGATHPNVVAHEGETYRSRLENLAQERGVADHVLFHNKFVSLEELKEYIGAADIYVTPYLNPAQITSGTLAYTFGAGKAVISTPYWHAEELLAEDRGVLVPFQDPPAIAAAVDGMLTDEAHRHAMRKNAYLLGREMIWPETARRYMETFARARAERARRTAARPPIALHPVDRTDGYRLPDFKIDHLRRLTDSTGIIQHAVFTVPNYHEGYCTDDNARGYILTALFAQQREGLAEADLVALGQLNTTYLAFLWHAWNPETNRFRNFMAYDRRWLDDSGTEDAHGRALWALGTALGRSGDPGHQALAARMFEMALPAVQDFTSPRAWAFAVLAVHEYLRRFHGDREADRAREMLTARLVDLHRRVSGPDWDWFEDVLTYDNARLPHALILTGRFTDQPEVLETGLRTLRWLLEIQTGSSGAFTPIGSNGFYARGKVRARFDQQPLEAYATVSACLEAHRITGDAFWRAKAERVFEWFLGRNDLGLSLYDAETGGCRDGLHPDRVNENQGAESTLSFHLALAEMRLSAPVGDLVPVEEKTFSGLGAKAA